MIGLRIFVWLYILVGMSTLAVGRENTGKREMRGVWIATVNNIDWPSGENLSATQQQKEVQEILDRHQEQGINAIFFQLRPSGDAFYPSKTEPWSTWLGTASLSYDPLAYWIDQSHQRGMEFHAWFNPYRVVANIDRMPTDPKHIVHRHPEWVLTYGQRMYLDPGLPPVQDYVVGVIAEVVKNYDLDGVHFDDYFYPYKITGTEFPDQKSYQRYGQGFENKSDWRRANTDHLIRKVNTCINELKPYLKFGISPFGVWRNEAQDPTGSTTKTDQTSYDDLYADVIKWLKLDWIDYVTPQIYWNIGYHPAAYEVLLDWWSRHSFDKHVYIGQAAYKINGKSEMQAWKNPLEMPNHLRLNARYPQVKGNIYFSSKSLRANPLGFADSLRSDFYQLVALPPDMPWKNIPIPKTPSLYRVSSSKKEVKMYWQPLSEDQNHTFAVIYRFAENQSKSLDDPNTILAVVPHSQQSFVDHPENKGIYTYLITTLNRSGQESKGSYPIRVGYRRKISP